MSFCFFGSLAERGFRCVSRRSLSFFCVFVLKEKINASFFFYSQISLMTHYLFSAALRSIRFTLAHSLVCVLASKRLLVGGSMKGQRWPARRNAPLSTLAVLCQSGTQNSYEKYFLCDRLSLSGTAKAAQSRPAGTLDRHKQTLASIWKDFSFDLTNVCL